MLVGSVGEVPVSVAVTSEEVVLPPSESSFKLPPGIWNLGNTCYLNAVVQMLYSIPEFRLVLQICHFSSTTPDSQHYVLLCEGLKYSFKLMTMSAVPLTPMFLLNVLHSVCPQFAPQARDTGKSSQNPYSRLNPNHEQQDASECWTELVRGLQTATIDFEISTSIPDLPESFRTNSEWNPVDRFLTGQLLCKLSCTESEEPELETVETFNQLSCFINQDVKYLVTGIRNGFTGNLTKHSPLLNRDAVYKRTSLISRLPAYLSIHFVRFFYKEDKQVNAKILKDVKFPLTLDMHEFCTPELQKKLLPMREKIHLLDQNELTNPSNQTKSAKLKADAKQPDPYKNPELYEPYWFSDDPGSNNSGYYELQGVLSHQGRTSTSGHYVAWIKTQGVWLKYDDHRVSQVTEEDILRLSGGGDWHCAYILLYGPRCVKKESCENTANNAEALTANGNSMNHGDHSNCQRS
ncbi:unnamed protein product [Trichobilharzia szidati]|nr:unnamed protein product [Trichobilharzia szidati]